MEVGEKPTFPIVSMDVEIQGSAQNLKPGKPEMHKLYSCNCHVCIFVQSPLLLPKELNFFQNSFNRNTMYFLNLTLPECCGLFQLPHTGR